MVEHLTSIALYFCYKYLCNCLQCFHNHDQGFDKEIQPCEFPTAEGNCCGNCRGKLVSPQQKNAEDIFLSSILLINPPDVY